MTTIQCDVVAEHETHPGYRAVATGRPGGLALTPVICPGRSSEGTRVTPLGTGKDQRLTAGTCTPTNCVNLNDPVAQANCSLC